METVSATANELTWSSPLVWITLVWLIVVGCALPMLAQFSPNKVPMTEIRGLNLARGSVRALIALMIIGIFVVFLVLGSPHFQNTAAFDNIVTALAALSGSVTGFYFGARAATPSPELSNDDEPPKPPNGRIDPPTD